MRYSDNENRMTAVLRVLATFIAAQLGGILLWWMFGGLGEGFGFRLLMHIICTLLTNTVAFVLICGGVRLPKRRKEYSHFEPAAFFFSAVFIACAAAMLWKMIFVNENSESTSSYSGIQLILYIGYTVILVPIAEEIAFRGAALSRLSAVFGMNSAALISALFFAAYHMDIIVFAYTFVLGYFLAVLAQRSGSLVPCMVVHAANNLLTLAVGYSDSLSKVVNIALPVLGAAAIAWLIITNRVCRSTTDEDKL